MVNLFLLTKSSQNPHKNSPSTFVSVHLSILQKHQCPISCRNWKGIMLKVGEKWHILTLHYSTKQHQNWIIITNSVVFCGVSQSALTWLSQQYENNKMQTCVVHRVYRCTVPSKATIFNFLFSMNPPIMDWKHACGNKISNLAFYLLDKATFQTVSSTTNTNPRI